MKSPELPPPLAAVDAQADEFHWLLDGLPLAPDPALADSRPEPALRARVMQRVAQAAQASRAFFTVRQPMASAAGPSATLRSRVLYQCQDGRALRVGEPLRVRLLQLPADSHWRPDLLPATTRCEWLVMSGECSVAHRSLSPRDYLLQAGQADMPEWHSVDGATVYLRESAQPQADPDKPLWVRDAQSSWDDFAPGIRRRVLWSEDGQAAMLYHALPGAAVPQHGHGHDEECLMLEGEVFLDDELLRCGDYQLAPAGTRHQGISTDTGGILFAHGDFDLDLLPA